MHSTESYDSHTLALKSEKVADDILKRTCTLCNKILSKKSYLKYHVQNVHNKKSYKSDARTEEDDLREKTCTLCDKILSNKYYLITHMKNQHLAEWNPNCADCGYSFKTYMERRKHKLQCTGVRSKLGAPMAKALAKHDDYYAVVTSTTGETDMSQVFSTVFY